MAEATTLLPRAEYHRGHTRGEHTVYTYGCDFCERRARRVDKAATEQFNRELEGLRLDRDDRNEGEPEVLTNSRWIVVAYFRIHHAVLVEGRDRDFWRAKGYVAVQ